MKNAKRIFAVGIVIALAFTVITCATSGPKVRVVELENKGTALGVSTPNWIKLYTERGISALQASPEFRNVYCVVGEESGVNRQFVLAWADNFSAQQRIGAMLRTTITSAYQAQVTAEAQSQGGGTVSASSQSGNFRQEINNVINAIVEVSYSGAQREADWWSLRRRYDPDLKDVYSDEYTAYVLYTIPKQQLNNQIARALETAVSRDSELYDITIQMARQIMLGGMDNWGDTIDATGSGASSPVVQDAIARPNPGPVTDGTYTLFPRPRASNAAVAINAYIDRVVIQGSYMVIYMSDVSTGMRGRPEPGAWQLRDNVKLTDLDNPRNVWQPIRSVDDPDGRNSGQAISFENVTARRFKLECDWYGNNIFEEIVLNSPDR